MEQNNISRLLRKIRTIQFVCVMAQCLVLAGATYLTWKLASQIAQQYLWSSPVIVSISGGTLFLFLFSRTLAWMASRNHRMNAAEVDRYYDLRERITTYLDLQNSLHPFLEPLIRETSSKLTNVSALRVSGVKSAMFLPGALLLLLISALLLLPYLPVPETILAKKQEQKRIASKAKELEEFARQLDMKQPGNPELKRMSQEFKKLAQELQRPSIDKAEALKKLNALEEKQKKLHFDNQQKLANQLKETWQEAIKTESGDSSLTGEQKAAIEQLARDFQAALEGQEPRDGIDHQKLNTEQFSSKDLKTLKEALKKYQEQKSQAEQMRAKLKTAIDNARKTTSSGKGGFTTDSRLKDRDLEKGKGGVEDGPGTTNLDLGPSRFDTAKKGKGEYAEDRTRAQYDQLYQGQRENAGKDPLYLHSQWNENGDPQYTRIRNFGLDKDAIAKDGSNPITAQSQDESSIRKERVPPSYQKIVKKYFEAIEE